MKGVLDKMPIIEWKGKKYKVKNLPRGAHLMTDEWVARCIGLPLDVLKEMQNEK